MKFTPKGPPRFMHQRRGLKKMIDTGGVTAILFDPGLGKTATVLDYASILALKSARNEARVLVVAPLAAVDTWVSQAMTYVTDDVSVWAEALGGSLRDRAQALASRGGNPMRGTAERGPKDGWQGPRAAHWDLAWVWAGRKADGGPVAPQEGPEGLGSEAPRLIIEVVNIDTFAIRSQVCRRHMVQKCKDPICRGKVLMSDIMVQAVQRYGPDLIVMDESHKIKSAGGNASRLMARLTPLARRRVLMSGTVMPHSPMDIFAQWRFLDPLAFGDRQPDGSIKQATMGGFRSRFAVEGGWMGKQITGYRDLDTLQDIMAKNAIVARKAEALDLPPVTDVVIDVHLSERERSAYDQMVDKLAASFLTDEGLSVTATTNNRLTQMMRLRQITSGFVPDDDGDMQSLGESKSKVIASLVHDNLAGEPRIVIFALFTKEIELLAKAIAKKDTEVMVITGGTSVQERLRMRQRFGTSPAELPQRMVMIAQIKTMSLAVNELVTANHAIFASLSQQRDDLIQARDRLNRIGQTRPVTFWFALAPKTVDEVIMDSHEKRTNLETAMLRHIQEAHRERHQNPLIAEAVSDALDIFDLTGR